MKNLTRVELDRLLAVAKSHSELDALMLLVMFNHGLRVSEAIGLTREHIVGGHLVIQRLKGSRKTNQPLLPDEKARLEALAATVEGRFFKMDRTNAWRRMQKYGREAGIEAFRCHPHILKHTTGRLGYEGGMGIAELQSYLGHESGKSTMVYLEAPEHVACSAFAAAVGK
jgi:type 1 fimbriae regulatory protein FimB